MPYVVERKPLSLSERLYLPQILAGMRVTLKHLFAPNVTMQYPEERPPIPTGYRGVPTLVKDRRHIGALDEGERFAFENDDGHGGWSVQLISGSTRSRARRR